ncbi:MAG: nuclear transport factor 2 family protein [Bacteroidia bacterium]|jgi:hypothetical protein|nr:nuclear transport factor 2 family protein [Bacteroidia bacterium]
MYRYIIKQIILGKFRNEGEGNIDALLNGFAENFIHISNGNNALGGSRTTRESAKRWFERLLNLLPGFRLNIQNIRVSGYPWNTSVTVEWSLQAQPASGSFTSDGVHILTLVWGKVVSLHTYLDTQKTSELLQKLAALNITEAAQPPITDYITPKQRSHELAY